MPTFHKFDIAGSSYKVADTIVVAIYAIGQLKSNIGLHTHVATAVKLLRANGVIGLYDSNKIVDFIFQYGEMDGVNFSMKPASIRYSGTTTDN